jgi:hypothetical protein
VFFPLEMRIVQIQLPTATFKGDQKGKPQNTVFGRFLVGSSLPLEADDPLLMLEPRRTLERRRPILEEWGIAC